MPGVKPVYVPPGDKDLDALVDAERKQRAAAIDEARNYYHGQHKKPLKSGENVILNLTAQALDDLVEFMGQPRLEVPGGVSREPGADGTLQELKSDAQLALEAWWEAQDLPEFLTEVALSGMQAGHVFIRLYEDGPGVPVAALMDPRMVTVLWDAGSVYRPLWYRVLWTPDEGVLRCQDLVPGWLMAEERRAVDVTAAAPGMWLDVTAPADAWHIVEYEQSVATANRWQEVAHDVWLQPFAPLVEWKNQHAPHAYYGAPDVLPRLNDAVNFIASNTAKIVKHHAAPQTVVTGGHLGDDPASGPGSIIEIDEPEAKVYNLEMTADIANSLAYLDKLESRFFAEMRVVDLTGMKDKLGQITNFGVRMLFIKMLNKIATKRRLYGKGLAEVSRRALAVMGEAVERVEATWADPLPVNRTELVQTLEKEKALGVVSKQTASEDLGRDFESEQERIAEEGTKTDEALGATLERFGQRGLFA